MEAFYSDDSGTLFQGDSIKVLLDLPKHYVNSCITSPPYWALRDYHSDGQLGQETKFSEYIEKLCTYFDAVYDVLVPEGTLWVNLGDTYYGSNKGQGGKSVKQDSNKGSRFVVNKNNKGSQLDNAQKFKSSELPSKSLCLIPPRFAIAMQERGWILRNDIIWHKPNKFPESAKDRFTHDYEHLFMFSKQSKYYFEQQLEPYKESSKKRYQSGWNGAVDKGVSWTGISQYLGTDKAKARAEKGRNKRSVWSINTESVKGLNHFAKFPRELIRAPILASAPENGIVLDIFFGSGTTGIVAEELNRKWVGIDISEEYCKMAIGRIKEWRDK